jgi:uncharacterized protein (TIGR02611 family)
MHSFGTLMRFIWRSSKRAAVFVLGASLLVVGFIMFVTPGPGIVLVVAGLAILATEFAWAEHLLDKAKEQAARAGESAQRVPGVSAATAAAGRLVPRRWRRTRVDGVMVTETTADGVVHARAAVVSTTVTTYAADPGEPREVETAPDGAASPADDTTTAGGPPSANGGAGADTSSG